MEPMLIIGVVGAVLGTLGLLGLGVAKKINTIVGTPFKQKAETITIVMVIVGILLGGFGFLWGSVSSAISGSTATIVGSDGEPVTEDYTGFISLKLHDGISNSTTTEDYLNDDEDFMDIYSADANIEDGQEYKFNITIDRSEVAYAATVKVSCTIADKEISGVTADNLAEKTSGKIDLDINNGGSFVGENTVYKLISFSAGDASEDVEVAFDQEETYHDGMTDMDDYVDVVCEVSDVDQTLDATLRIKANS